MRYAELVLNLMRCIAASSAAEDEQEESNQQTPAMLKKSRPTSKPFSPIDDEVMLLPVNGSAANGHMDSAQKRKKEREDAELQWPVDAEMFGAAEIAEMAALLLRMILELCGESVLGWLLMYQ